MSSFSDLINILQAIAGLSKDIHYNLRGSAFIANHEYMDDVHNVVVPYIDEIKENYFMYNDLEVPKSSSVYEESAKIIKDYCVETSEEDDDDLFCITGLIRIIKIAIYTCGELSESSISDVGDKDLLGRLSTDLKKINALLGRIII